MGYTMAKKMEYLKPYLITFLDHVIMRDIEDKTPLMQVVGFYLGKDKDFYEFSYWEMLTDDDEAREDNRETFRIVKSAITKIKRLK